MEPIFQQPMKVLIFGTFDHLHPGHEYVFREAAKHGRVVAVVARDETVKRVKGTYPHHSEQDRLRQVSKYVDAVLGHHGSKMKVIEEQKPDIICLGYDQEAFVDELKAFIAEKKLKMPIVRLKPYKPEIYKGRLLQKQDSKGRQA